MDGGALLGAPLLFALELVTLYAAGSYAMGRLIGIWGFGGGGTGLGRMVFYLLICSSNTSATDLVPRP